jgi:hypothetical protein
MNHLTLTAEVDRGDAPEIWEAILATIETKYPDYVNGEVSFYELPPHGYGSYFQEPNDASATVSGHHPTTYAKLPSMKMTVECADVKASDMPDAYEPGYLVTVEENWPSKPQQIVHYLLTPNYGQGNRRLSGFEYLPLTRVEGHDEIKRGRVS